MNQGESNINQPDQQEHPYDEAQTGETMIKEEGTMGTDLGVNQQQMNQMQHADQAQLNISSTIYTSLPGQYFITPRSPEELISLFQEEERSLRRVEEALKIQLSNLEEEAELLQQTKEQFDAAQGKV